MFNISSETIKKRLRENGLDPYIVWGLQTGFADFARQKTVAATQLFRVVIELSPGGSVSNLSTKTRAHALTLSVADAAGWTFSIPPIYLSGDFRFVTATVSPVALGALALGAFDLLIERFCLTTALADPASLEEPFPVESKDLRSDALGDRVIAVVDTGCPFLHNAFRDPGNRSRVRFLWDQGRVSYGQYPSPPWRPVYALGALHLDQSALLYGREIGSADMDDLTAQQAVRQTSEHDVYMGLGYRSLANDWTHGGAVLGLAAGDQRAVGEETTDTAATLPIIFVQLAQTTAADAAGLSMAGYVLDAMHYIRLRTRPDTRIALTLSFGRHAGPHDGSSIIEKAIDDFVEKAGRQLFVSVAAGNTNEVAGHSKFEIDANHTQQVTWQIPADMPTASLMELWFESSDVSVELVAPLSANGAPRSICVGPGEFATLCVVDGVIATAVHSVATTQRAGAKKNCVLLAVAPTVSVDGTRVEAAYGNWTVRVSTTSLTPLMVHAWIERAEQLAGEGWPYRQSTFAVDQLVDPSDEYPANSLVTKFTTLNGIATGDSVTIVGASYSDGSLTNYTAAGPELSGLKTRTIDMLHVGDETIEEPGVPVIMSVGVGVGRMNGTSAAAPRAARGWISLPSGLHLPTWPSRTPPELSDQRGRL
jgi:hypothetical protein